MKKLISVLLTITVIAAFLPAMAFATDENKTDITRYTVLLLDTSRSMYGNPEKAQKEAAVKFCNSMLKSKGTNKIAIVEINTPSGKICDFTSDAEELARYINGLSSEGGTDTAVALNIADEMLTSADTGEKNIVLCSDGLPQWGEKTYKGPYSASDYEYYAEANYVYYTAEKLKDKDLNIYTLGFFHSLSGDTLDFGRKLMKDLQNSGYYEVTNPDDLEFVFEEIEEVIVEPVTIDLDDIELVEESNTYARYSIYASIKNNSKKVDLTNLMAALVVEDAKIIDGEERQTKDVVKADKSTVFSWQIEIDKTKYPDGGVYHFEVVVTSDQTIPQVHGGSINIEATNNISNELDFSTDVWGFRNFSEELKNISSEDREPCPVRNTHLNILLTDLSAADKKMLKDAIADGFGGHCYGMSATVILDKMNAIDLSEFTSTPVIRNAENHEFTHSIIGYWHVTQFLDAPKACVSYYMSSLKSDRERLSLLADKADKVKDGGCPVLFGFGVEGWGAHAIVAYALESGSFKSSKSGKTYNRRVLMYDCNAVDWKEDNCLLFNEGTGEWEIPAYYTYKDKNNELHPGAISTNPKAYLKRCASALDDINVKDYQEGMINYVAELRCKKDTELRMTVSNTGQTWTIKGNSGDIEGSSELISYSDDGTIETGSMPALNIILPDENAEYKLRTASGGSEELDVSMRYDDVYMSVSSDAAKGTDFGNGTPLSLVGNEGTFEISLADDNIQKGEFNTYDICGDNEGDITVSITNSGLDISGDNLNGIEITASDDTTTSTTVIDEDTSEVHLIRTDNKLQTETYTLDFETNGGSDIDSISAAPGSIIELSSYVPSKNKYKFAGWFTDEGLTDKVTRLKIVEDTTVYAKYVKKSSSSTTNYAVNFDTNGGNSISSLRIKMNSVINEPTSPTKKGFVFGGWYTDEDCTEKYDFSEKVTQNMTLYAKWFENVIVLTIGKKDAVINGEIKTNDVAPKIVNDRTMLPIRFIAEELGADVEWEQATRTVTVEFEDTTISIAIGSDTAYVNKKAVKLDSPAFIENDRTYLPIRFIMERMGADVQWNQSDQTVTISK